MDTNLDEGATTFGGEEDLPRVPLPTLEQSCQRFLEWCEPLLSGDERTATEEAAASFLLPDGPGRKLQRALEQYDTRGGSKSWLDAFWPDRYLGRRDRIALNANFFFLFEASEQGQVDRAAGLVAASLHYKRLIDEQRLAPVIQRGRPLSMEQNKYLFSATRIPGAERDSVRTPYSNDWPGPSLEHHIVVFVRGNMFRLDVVGPNGRPHTLDELASGLRAVMAAGATAAAPGTSVGHLTTKARAEWAASRRSLLDCHPANATALDTVETALFCLCLDDTAPDSPRDAADHLLRADGGNRWFDKALSLVVFSNGTAGVNGEHSKMDGTTIVEFIDHIHDSSPEHHSSGSRAQPQGMATFAPIEFALDADLRTDIRASADSFASSAADTTSAVLSIDGFDSDRAKQLGMSPDAFAQMAFQLAHQRAKGRVGTTYESISTRHYQHGRTEAMRVVTPEVVQFVATMDDADASEASRRKAFRAAADQHVRRAKECQGGQAPEQHLWELQRLQQRRGTQLGATEPIALYETPGWVTMRDDYLSTSAIPSTHIQYFGFGSTSNKCIGIGYALLPERFDLYLSTPLSVSDQMALFVGMLPDAVRELEKLLDQPA